MKRSITSKFLRRIRIRGGEFDASARAMHREAAIGNVPSATIERTNMSTKTTLKRVSLVAVAAMGFGLLSVVPSSATPQSDTLTLGTQGGSAVVGGTVTMPVTQTFIGSGVSSDTMTVTVSLLSSPTGNAVLPTLVAVPASSINTVPTALGLVGQAMDSTTPGTSLATAVYTASMSGLIAGDYTIKFTPLIGTGNYGGTVAGVATAKIWTFTVGNAAAATAADTTSILNLGNGTGAAVDAVISADKTATSAAGSQAGTIVVTPKSAGGVAITGTTTLTAVITSGPGTLAIGATIGAAAGLTPQGRALTGTAVSTAQVIGVFADGTSGVSVITISAGSLVLSTETVTFYGAIASIVTTVVNSVIAVGTTAGAITAVAKDANGVVVPSGTLYATSDTVGVISNSYAVDTTFTGGVATFSLVGVAAGSANITVGTGTSATVTVPAAINATAVAVRVGSAVPSTVTVTFDKATYLPGEAAVVTVSLLDASGKAVLPGTYSAVFATGGLVSNFGLTGTGAASLTSTSVVVTSATTGAVDYAVVMPTSNADLTLTGTTGTGLLPVANQGVAITASVTVAADTTATDAANAATDAANYAADAADAATSAAEEATAAALAAQDSADAATTAANAASAAVVALGLRVEKLYKATRSQVLSLQKLVVRLIKKLHA